ncbi:response regulator transcription factor [Vallitalea sediminicola]
MVKILAIDDELDILALIKNSLIKDNHIVVTENLVDNIDPNNLSDYDMILLDIMMPGTDGFTFCQNIRNIVDCPIIFLTARTTESDIINGLALGADDYITKPFGTGELRARVNAHLRREQREKHSILCASGIRFDLSAKEATIENQKIPFTKSEYNICEFLARNRGQVFSRDQIYEAIYGYERESDVSTIAEHIKNIRGKLSVYNFAPISTVWGIGYKWN